MTTLFLPRRQPARQFAQRLAALLPAALLLTGGLPRPVSAAAPPKKTLPTPTYTQAVVYVTAKSTGQRMQPGPPLHFAPDPQPNEDDPTIMLDPAPRFQTILGFGGAFTDAAAETYAKLPPAKQREVITAYFSPTRGLGYTLGRTSINSCDFSSDTYSYDDAPGDTALSHFSIAHDLKYRVPFIQAALAEAHGPFTLFASPWSPPAWMKTNGDMAHGGQLKPEDRQAWADYYVRFVQAYRQHGIPVWGVTVQNEPMSVQSWESCLYSGADERDFVRDFLGPTLKKSNLGTHLMIWDHNRGIMYQRAEVVYDDPIAAPYVWGMAYHAYTGDHFDNPQTVHNAFPGKNLLFTEGSQEFTTDSQEEWRQGEWYGKNILLDLSHWAAGWTDWNLLLNQQGGPNHAGNFCSAPVMADTAAGTLEYRPSYYYLGQFAKFIRPGAQRIASTSNSDDLQCVAFLNPDSSLAVVVLNLTREDQSCRLWIAGRSVTTTSPAHSIFTAVLKR